MKLVPIIEQPDRYDILYRLLAERQPHQNISHKSMPTWEQHCAFVDGEPYQGWYIIDYNGPAGACYLTYANEIGIQLFEHSQGLGLGPMAVQELMRIHGPRRYLANVAPGNARSAVMFKNMGFEMIQRTFCLEPSE